MADLSVVLYRTLCNRLKQCATLPRLQIGKILSICVLVLPLWYNKTIQFCRFPGEGDLIGKNVLQNPLLNVIRHAQTKFAPLYFINKTPKQKDERETLQPNIPFLKYKLRGRDESRLKTRCLDNATIFSHSVPNPAKLCLLYLYSKF